MSEASQESGICALCGESYSDWGHNPQPVLPSVNQRVCAKCNWYVVLPARFEMWIRPQLERDSPKE